MQHCPHSAMLARVTPRQARPLCASPTGDAGRRAWLRNAACLCASAGALPAWAQAAREPLPVLYPDIGEPFRAVFEKIMDGIDEKLPQRALRLAVAAQSDTAPALAELRRRRPGLVIALGRAGLRAAASVEGPLDIVGSGVIGPTDSDARVAALHSLAPDPSLLLARLRQLQPGVKRVQVVYSPANSAWLMRLAQQAARAQGLELRVFEADDLRGAVLRYQELLADATPHDALWLPQDPVTVEESTIVPLVLREAWNRALPLFSSNLAHVRRGALFALFPNNTALGHRLATTALALSSAAGGTARGVMPLREVFASLNTRTAGHLGVDFNPKQHGSYDLLLPER